MSKDFEDKKQEIIQFMNKSLILVPDHKANTFIISDSNSSELENKIKQLQPPKPPTCSTCEHFMRELDNAGSCQKLVANEIINFTDGIATLVFIDFGCIHHSDYEVAEC